MLCRAQCLCLGLLQVVGVAKDQNGCRFLQRKFEEGGAAAIAAVFPEILDNLIELMIDPFGNYLIQKLLDRCSEEQRLQVKAADAPVSTVNVQSGHDCECKTGVVEALLGRELHQEVMPSHLSLHSAG